jgi:hypothetical protein
MNRPAFLTLYIIITLFFSGGLASVWTVTVMALALGEKGPVALLSPLFIISVLSPIVLIVLAYLRGKRIGNSKLLWFPIAALGLTLLPLLLGLLTKLLSGSGNVRPTESIGLYATMFVSSASTLGPLILNTICCVVGGKNHPVSVTTPPKKSGARSTLKIIVVLVLFLLIGGYYYSTRPEKVHWSEEAVLQDGRTLNVQRTVALSNSTHKSPQYYSLKVSHPDTGKSIEWEGDYGYNPVLIDFFEGVPYLVILQFNVFANLKQYGCPDIPYVFFRYDMNKKYWEQVPSSTFPSALSHANLTASYDGGDINEGTWFTQKVISLRNAELNADGYFSNTIPKDFDSWDFERKYEERNGHYKDGCHSEKSLPIPLTARRVSFTVAEQKDYEPESVFSNSDEPGSPWQKLSWDKERSEQCKTLLGPETPGVQGWSYFIQDVSGKKRMRVTGPLICDIDTVWAFDYVVEKRRVVIAKYRSNGDLAFRVSFSKPDEPGGYQGSVMYPTFKFDNDHLSFEWWNINFSGHDVHVKRSMKINVRELLHG